MARAETRMVARRWQINRAGGLRARHGLKPRAGAEDVRNQANSAARRAICSQKGPENFGSSVFGSSVGHDVVHVLDVSKCQESNYGTGRRPAKKAARPAKKPRASSRGRRSPPAEPLSPATVGAPPSPPSPGAKIDAALASPEAPPPAPPSSPDEPDEDFY